MGTSSHAAHDLLVNTDMGDTKQPDWMVRVKEDYFKAGRVHVHQPRARRAARGDGPHGGGAAVLLTNLARPSERALVASSTSTPTASASVIGGHNLLRPMENLRTLEAFVARPPGRVHDRRPELLGRRDVPAERRGVLPPLHEVLRARTAAVHEHRAARAADPG